MIIILTTIIMIASFIIFLTTQQKGERAIALVTMFSSIPIIICGFRGNQT